MQKEMKVTVKIIRRGRKPVSLRSKRLFQKFNTMLQYPKWTYRSRAKNVEKKLCDNKDTSFLTFNRYDPSTAFLCFKKLIQSTQVAEVPSLTLTMEK